MRATGAKLGRHSNGNGCTREAGGERFEKYIGIAIESIRDDFGLNDHKRCESCKHWAHRDGNYGDCEFKTTCTHKGEICKKWEEK